MSALARAADHWGVDPSAPALEPETYEEWMLAQGMAPRTISQRVIFAEWREREWPEWKVTAPEIARWLENYSSWTRITYHTHLVSIFHWLLDTRQIARSPMDRMKRPPRPSAKPRPLTPAEVDAVLEGQTGNMRAWLLLARFAGLRAHEIAKIRGEDVDADWIRVLGKGGKDSTLPTHPALWELAQEYPRRGYWFPARSDLSKPMTTNQITKTVGYRFRDVGLESGSIHRLRMTYGTTLVRAGANMRVVQTLMRHSSLATTEMYLAVDDDERTVAIRMLGGSL